jgi:hypothetical protein
VRKGDKISFFSKISSFSSSPFGDLVVFLVFQAGLWRDERDGEGRVVK